MSERRRIVAANWKMFKTTGEAREFVAAFTQARPAPGGCDAVICPPFTALAAVAAALSGAWVRLGAQNMHHEAEGAFTGEISPPMLQDLGVEFVIIGHSERRRYFQETDALIREKVQAAFIHGLTPILCVGETGAEREADATETVIDRQVAEALAGRTTAQVAGMVIAYEPVWAIGSGRPCDPAEADRVAALVRRTVARVAGEAAARAVRIQYGGSVKPENIGDFLARENIDGALVGGASLDPAAFARLVG